MCMVQGLFSGGCAAIWHPRPIRFRLPQWVPRGLSGRIFPMFFAFVFRLRHNRIMSWTNRKLYTSLLYILAGYFSLLFGIYFVDAVGGMGDRGRVANAGVFQLFRLAQFIFVYRVASGIPLTPRRIKIMSRIVDFALVAAFIGVVGTFTSAIPTRLLVSHLPKDFGTAGPWGYLSFVQMKDVGTIGYNHAYTAAQFTILMYLAMNLAERSNPFRDSFYMLVGMAGIFLSGSRAGLAAAFLMMVVFYIRKPRSFMTSVAAVVVVLAAGAGVVTALVPDLHTVIDRQLTVKDPLESDNLSGRQYIWRDSLGFIQQNPVRWIIGAGPGSVAQQQYNAHMLYLHIIMETGLIGLVAFWALMLKITAYLRRFERGAKPVLLATVAFLISSLTQETFYPVPAFGHFLGLYLCAAALAVRLDRDKKYVRCGAATGRLSACVYR
jgi:hypothetical protein